MPRIKKIKDVQVYIQDFIDYCGIKGLSKKTIMSYYQTLTLFARYLEEEKDISDISKVDKEVVEAYLEFTKERGKYSYIANVESLNLNYQQKRKDLGEELSDATLNNYLRNIKVFFNWLEENLIIRNNTVSKVKFIKLKRKAKD